MRMQHNEKRGKGSKLTDIVTPEDRRRDRALMALILRFLKDEGAATAIEYGLIAAEIAVAVSRR
jgi:hypothetical protein